MTVTAQPWADKVTQRRVSRHVSHNLLVLGERTLNGHKWTHVLCDCQWSGLLRTDQIEIAS